MHGTGWKGWTVPDFEMEKPKQIVLVQGVSLRLRNICPESSEKGPLHSPQGDSEWITTKLSTEGFSWTFYRQSKVRRRRGNTC